MENRDSGVEDGGEGENGQGGKQTNKNKWYPGKKIHEMLVARAEKKAGDASESRYQKKKRDKGRLPKKSTKPIGKVEICILECEELKDKSRFLEIEVEGESQELGYKETELAERSLSFEVSDPTSDICIFLLDEGTFYTESLGRIIIPLTAFYQYFEVVPKLRFWAEFLPFPSSDIQGYKFRSAYDGCNGSGLVKPKKALERVLVEVRLSFEMPLWTAYWTAEPFSPPEEVQVEQDEEGEDDISIVALRGSIFRLKKCMSSLHVPRLMCTFPSSLLFLALFYFLCFSAPVPTWPLVFALLVLLNGIISKYSMDGSSIKVWEKDIEPGDKGIISKVMLLKRVIVKFQGIVGHIASRLEVAQNAFNFSDQVVSLICFAFLFMWAVAASFVLSVIPLSLLAFLLLSIPFLLSLRPLLVKANPVPAEKAKNLNPFLSRIPNGLEIDHRMIAQSMLEPAN